ncbi:MAG: hypothetical protein EZS28_003577 [Streblomastix strix]|uniref:Uncharacterized protein n=1 Tax=Streblomastix strix TaxID=222440 RepID=A0A5J4X2D1_9EUKA|nr:MAG: hypothetical protein EZS28_003577 [Streblomastix strix]
MDYAYVYHQMQLIHNNPIDSVRIGVDEQTPERVRKEIGSEKVMITVFWGAVRFWHIHALPHGKSMTTVKSCQA